MDHIRYANRSLWSPPQPALPTGLATGLFTALTQSPNASPHCRIHDVHFGLANSSLIAALVRSWTPNLSLTLSSSSLVCSDASAACCCASNAYISSGDMVDTSRSGEPEPPPQLAEVFAGEEVKENMVHTQMKISHNCNGEMGGGVVNYRPPRKKRANRRSVTDRETCGLALERMGQLRTSGQWLFEGSKLVAWRGGGEPRGPLDNVFVFISHSLFLSPCEFVSLLSLSSFLSPLSPLSLCLPPPVSLSPPAPLHLLLFLPPPPSLSFFVRSLRHTHTLSLFLCLCVWSRRFPTCEHRVDC